MKKKSTRGKGGRKKFSAGNALSPSKSLDENLALAATGEFALTQEQRDIFRFVALWKNRYASLFKDNPSESEGAALLHLGGRVFLSFKLAPCPAFRAVRN